MHLISRSLCNSPGRRECAREPISTIRYTLGVSADLVRAGELLRRARTAAGMTQIELADRLGVQQSVISAYESGRRQPSLPTLAKLIEATDHRLHVEVRPDDAARGLAGPLGGRVRQQRQRILDVAARYGATNLRVFGSVARGDERSDSDIDVLVDLPPDSGLLTLDAIGAGSRGSALVHPLTLSLRNQSSLVSEMRSSTIWCRWHEKRR